MVKVTLTIDGHELTVPSGTTVIEAAKRVGVEIPALCYDKNLEIVSSCRLCIVEIEGMPKLMTACSTPVSEGMVVHTESDKVVSVRRDLLQLLLDNHPNDCLTCQKAGDCLLQRYAYRYDVQFRKHEGERRGREIAQWTDTSSPYVYRDESKCILCGKCVRTCAEVETRQVLTFAERGFETKISADADQSLEESTCVSCNRCVTVCPVGALMDARVLGMPRSWETRSKIVKCRQCDFGCNMTVHFGKSNQVVGVTAKDASEGRPLCLKGRLRTELEYKENAKKPFKKVETADGRRFVETTWVDALEMDVLASKLLENDGGANE